jgi:phosphoadenosine phosphosulfate reductase
VWRNPNVRGQLSAAPIHNWTALHVWLYLLREHAPYNILYEHHLDRIKAALNRATNHTRNRWW